MARRCSILPVQVQGPQLIVAMAEPQNLQVIDELRFKTGMQIVPRMGFRVEINAAIDKHYGAQAEAPASAPTTAEAAAAPDDEPGMEFISSSQQQRNIEAMQAMQAELHQKSKTTPAVRIVASMIRAAVSRRASDIHIEPQAAETSVRLRIDGLLRDFERIPRALQSSVASRIKILSDMDIGERRTPHDGRFLVKIQGRRLDLRVSTLPTQYGEKVVMRLLEADAPLHDFSALSFPQPISENFKRLLCLPQGLILVTGPTGSGKSTTLYSSLNVVRNPSVNIITVEDPVEYALPGLNQVQVNTKAGLTFASCLRSILRQDPNVIMVGEIRDRETAEIAMKAAQTGHLVLSTLHTNDSASAITRLLDLGVPGFQIAASVTAIIAQRLVRRLCACRKATAATPEYISRLFEAGMQGPPSLQYAADGCDDCDLTGYKGRVGICEMLIVDEAMRHAIRGGGRNDEIRGLARHNGMRLMYEYAIERVREGLTTLEEVQRVVPFEATVTRSCVQCGRELSAAFPFCPYCGQRRTGWVTPESQPPSLVEQGATDA